MIAYNEKEAVEGLLSDISLLEYPHKKIEIVFVDSMSTDGTYERMQEFREMDYGFLDVKIVRRKKLNQASSWNAALSTATGELIIRVDAHARIPRNFVSRNVYNIKQGEMVVGGGRPNISSDVSPWKLTLLAAEDSLFGSSVAAYRRPAIQKEYMDSLFHAAYRREVIATVGGFNEDLGRTEDNEFHYRIRMAGYKLCCCPDIISYQHSRNSLKHMVWQKYSNGRWAFARLRHVRRRQHRRLLHHEERAAAVLPAAVHLSAAAYRLRRWHAGGTSADPVLAAKDPQQPREAAHRGRQGQNQGKYKEKVSGYE